MTRVLITGATGFLGEHVLKMRPQAGFQTAAFVRTTSDPGRIPDDVVKVFGDLSDARALQEALQGVDVLINLASLGFGHAPAIVQACQEARVPRAVFISTTAIFTRLPAPSRAARLEAERLIAASGLACTILRPTMIYGTPRDRNIWRLIRFLRFSPLAPLVGGGRRLQQPIHVEDVAKAVWQVVGCPASAGKAYDLAGAQAVPMSDMVRTIARQLGRSVHLLPVPLPLALAGAAVARRLPFFPRISREQILRLDEDKAFDISPARKDFGFAPLDFEEGIRKELRWLGR